MLDNMQHDPVAVMQHLEQAIFHLEQVRRKSGGPEVDARKKDSPSSQPQGLMSMFGGMYEEPVKHELDDALRWLKGYMDKWMAKYGRMLWEASDSYSVLGELDGGDAT